MNLTKLYKMQAELDRHIIEKHNIKMSKEELLDNTILALLVEVGELANTTRCFKIWSNKGPNDKKAIKCELCANTGDSNYHNIMEAAESDRRKHEYIKCEECEGTGILGYKNPILEELADVWHFYLSIGNQLNIELEEPKVLSTITNVLECGMGNTFITLYINISDLAVTPYDEYATYNAYTNFGMLLRGLAYLLGFSNKEVEQAYLKKHEENYKRQREGY